MFCDTIPPLINNDREYHIYDPYNFYLSSRTWSEKKKKKAKNIIA